MNTRHVIFLVNWLLEVFTTNMTLKLGFDPTLVLHMQF